MIVAALMVPVLLMASARSACPARNRHGAGSWPFNANTGDVAWEVRLGLTELLPEGKQNTGNNGSAGPTVTAGGLVFIAATSDSRFRAFDAKTGQQLWIYKMEKNGNANPMVYQSKNGKEYVAILATDTVNVFALP
jgi:quinoprotein glucose dehydrogenase